MKVVILGGDGQVGRALAASAPAEVEAVALSRSECDIGVRPAVEAAIRAVRPALVFNAAAYTAVDRAESEPDLAGMVNAAAPGWIAMTAADAGARTVHLSSDYVFGGTSGRPYTPKDTPRPLSVYGRTKRAGEEAVAAADPGALIVRTAWVYAAAGRNFVTTMLRLMAERERIPVVADQVGTPTHAASLARALWGLALGGATGIHHFTDAGLASWYDFAVAIQEEALELGLLDDRAEIVPVRTADHPATARRPGFAVLDKTDTWSLLGRVPPHWRVNLRACLRQMAGGG